MMLMLVALAAAPVDGVESVSAPLRARAGSSVPLVVRLRDREATGAHVLLRNDGSAAPTVSAMRAAGDSTFTFDVPLAASAEEYVQYFSFEGLRGDQVAWTSDEHAMLVRPNQGLKPLTRAPFFVGVATSSACVVGALVMGLLLGQTATEYRKLSSGTAVVEGSKLLELSRQGEAYSAGLTGFGIGWFVTGALTGLIALFTDFEA